MTKFKALLKKAAKSELVYWAEVNGNQIIGTRQLAIRMQFVPDKMRAILAEVGLFAPNTARNAGAEATCPDLSKIFPENADGIPAIEDTGLVHPGKNLRIFHTESGFMYVNSTYFDAIDEIFPNNTLKSKGQKECIFFGNCQALLLPCIIDKFDHNSNRFLQYLK